ncbi:MAG: LamG domain-containing protein [Candidatus Poribacteria bacterium]|nr:LamG domain-containing protein [Candidatus Poribacteria bacterium]
MVRSIMFSLLTILMFITVSTLMAALEDDLVVYFTFDDVDGKTIRDSSGNGLDANIVANTEIVEGKNGDAIKITAEGADCVNVPADDKLKISGEITMAAWIWMEAWNNNSQWFDKNCHNGGEHTSYGIGVFGDGNSYNMFLGSDQNRQHLNKPHSLKAKTWHYVVGTYDGSAIKIYVDGKLDVEDSKAFKFTGTNDQDLRIGCSKDRPQYTFENGMIDDAAIWSRALNEGEISQAMGGELLAVTPKNKVATTWGNIKQRNIAY